MKSKILTANMAGHDKRNGNILTGETRGNRLRFALRYKHPGDKWPPGPGNDRAG